MNAKEISLFFLGPGATILVQSSSQLEIRVLEIPNLPSWVPNFATSSSINLYTQDITGMKQSTCYHTSCGFKSQLSTSNDSYLHITGLSVGMTKKVRSLPFVEGRQTVDLYF